MFGQVQHIVEPPFYALNHPRYPPTRARFIVVVQHIVKAVADNGLRAAGEVGDDGHVTRVVQPFLLYHQKFFIQMQTPVFACHRQKAFGGLVDLVQLRKRRFDEGAVGIAQHFCRRNHPFGL